MHEFLDESPELQAPQNLTHVLLCITPRGVPTCTGIHQEREALELVPCPDQDHSPGQVRNLVLVHLVLDPSPTLIVTVCQAGYYRRVS